MSLFFNQTNPVVDMLMAKKKLRELNAEIADLNNQLDKKNRDRISLMIYMTAHKEIPR